MVLEGRRLLAVAVAICAALVLGLVLWQSDQRSRTPSADGGASVAENGRASEQGGVPALTEMPLAPAEGPDEDQPFAGNHVNVNGGYLFSYPTSWTVRETGTLTELLGEDGRVAISFGLGPPGGIEPAYEDFVSLIDETYDGASVRLAGADLVEGNVRLKLSGTATTKAGFQIWFTARVIALRGEQSLATLAAGPLGSRDTQTDSANQILDSFAPIGDLGAG